MRKWCGCSSAITPLTEFVIAKKERRAKRGKSAYSHRDEDFVLPPQKKMHKNNKSRTLVLIKRCQRAKLRATFWKTRHKDKYAEKIWINFFSSYYRFNYRKSLIAFTQMRASLKNLRVFNKRRLIENYGIYDLFLFLVCQLLLLYSCLFLVTVFNMFSFFNFIF